MTRNDIEKEIAKSIVNSGLNIIGDEMANEILNEQKENFIDTNSTTKVDVVQIDDENIEDTTNDIDTDFDGKINDNNLGKFKNPEELLKAYNELEKEFTRRSQKLKELQKMDSEKQSTSKESWQEKVDKFFAKTPSAKAFAKDIAQKLLDNPSLKDSDDCLNVALNQVLLDNFRTPDEMLNDGQFLDTYVFSSKKIRDRIIADYLDDVRAITPPTTLMSGGVNVIAPSSRPRSIQEAGELFLKNNK